MIERESAGYKENHGGTLPQHFKAPLACGKSLFSFPRSVSAYMWSTTLISVNCRSH